MDETTSPAGSPAAHPSKTPASSPPDADERRALDVLREHQARFRTLAEGAPFVVWITDGNHGCTYLSPYWRALTGRDPQNDLGDTWAEALHPEDREAAIRALVRATRSAQPCRGEYRVKRADGQYGWVADRGVPWFDAQGSYAGHIGTRLDITEHKQRETTGFRVQDSLLLGQEAERKRVAREIHDNIGQQVALLALGLKEIERFARAESSALAEKLRAVEGAVDRLASDLHRLSHNLHPATVVHLGLVPALQRLCREVSEQTTIVIEFVGAATCTDMSEDVALALFRVSQECLANIAKHSQSREATVSLSESPTELRLTIADSGGGFDVSRVHAGSGLGFVSIHERARMLGADVEIRSTPSRGTTVELRLPTVRTQTL